MSNKPELGMYAVADPNYPQVKVGEFTICRQNKKNVWIQTEKGEGASFPDEVFEDAIRLFFNSNF